MFKNVFTTNWHPDQKSSKILIPAIPTVQKPKNPWSKVSRKGNFPGPPDRENGKDSWGFLDQTQPFFGVLEACNSKKAIN